MSIKISLDILLMLMRYLKDLRLIISTYLKLFAYQMLFFIYFLKI